MAHFSRMSPSVKTIPAFLNPDAGSAREAERVLREANGFDVRPVDAAGLERAIRDAVAEGARRIVIAGGDGSIATAAAVLVDTPVELAIIPTGTLNHFAKDHGVPEKAEDAVAFAVTGSARCVDVGTVNGRVFLNTSSAGSYVFFVRLRERLERRLGYWLASLIAALGLLFRLTRFQVELEVEGAQRRYLTPLVFIGVGERDTRLPRLGRRAPHGARALHIIVVTGRTRARVLALAAGMAFKGLPRRAWNRHVVHLLADACRIDMPRPRGTLALDGELVTIEAPLDYRLARGVLRLVAPPPGESR